MFINAPSAGTGQKDILILGNAYTPQRDKDYNGILYRYDEINHDLCKSLENLNVHIEHDVEKSVGKVIDSYISSEGDLMVFLHVSGDPICNTYLPEKLVKGPDGRRFFNDLSLAHDVMFKEEGGITSVVRKIPQEVSIVCTGDNPGTHIKDWWYVEGDAEAIRSQVIPDLILQQSK